MLKTAIIADPLTAAVFQLTDIFVNPVGGDKSAAIVFKELCDQKYNPIFITENLAETMREEIQEFQYSRGRSSSQKDKAIVVVIPAVNTDQHLGAKMLKTLRRKVIGV